jgi:hypothetical protein
MKKGLTAVIVPLLFFVLLEGVLRLVGFEFRFPGKVLWTPAIAGFMGTYEYFVQSELDPPGYIWRLPSHTPITDKRGFRLPGVPDEKAPGRKRIAFLGGSTTHGGYKAYPERTVELLNGAVGSNVYEHLNAACSSYSTHQSLLALKRWVLPLHPDQVVVYHGWNDAVLQDDGYSDREKDAAVSMRGLSSGRIADGIRRLRVTQWVAWCMGKLDRTWPRARVSMKRFERNLRMMAQLCGEADVALTLLTRPESQLRPLPYPGTNALAYYERMYHTRDPVRIYDAIHADQLAVLRRVADDYDHVTLIDVSTRINELQREQQEWSPGESPEVFLRDACHLSDFANQKLAEFVAVGLVSNDAAHVRSYLETPEYHLAVSQDFLANDQPFAAVYYADEAMKASHDVRLTERAAELASAGRSQYEFARLFREARQGGSDTNFTSRIRKLRQCQAMRPRDIGVCLQILRACHYEGRAAEAVVLMDLYHPSENPREKFEYLSYLFHSHSEGGRWDEAAAVAREMLMLRPDDRESKLYLERYKQLNTAGGPG